MIRHKTPATPRLSFSKRKKEHKISIDQPEMLQHS